MILRAVLLAAGLVISAIAIGACSEATTSNSNTNANANSNHNGNGNHNSKKP